MISDHVIKHGHMESIARAIGRIGELHRSKGPTLANSSTTSKDLNLLPEVVSRPLVQWALDILGW